MEKPGYHFLLEYSSPSLLQRACCLGQELEKLCPWFFFECGRVELRREVCHQGMTFLSRQKSPPGPPGAKVASHTGVWAASSTLRSASGPPRSVLVCPGQTEFAMRPAARILHGDRSRARSAHSWRPDKQASYLPCRPSWLRRDWKRSRSSHHAASVEAGEHACSPAWALGGLSPAPL